MPKPKVDKIIALMVTLTKAEVVELQTKLYVEHSVYSVLGVPSDKLGDPKGNWLLEADKDGS